MKVKQAFLILPNAVGARKPTIFSDAIAIIPHFEYATVKKNLKWLRVKRSQKNTWNAFKHRSASLEAVLQSSLGKLWGQGARFARRRSRFYPLTPQLARQNSSIAFDEAEPAAKAF